MISNGHVVGDGSWDLRIFVTNLQTERLIRVKGDTHMGGVMYKLTQDLEISMDWSDHGLWWPARNIWVNRVKFTLDQYGVQADALLYFTPMHKNLKVQLPDLRYIDMRVDVSVQTFSAVVAICKDLSIQHPEELSLCKPLEASHLKHNYKDMPKKKSHHDSSNGHHGGGGGGQHHPARNGSGGHPTPPPPPPDTNTFLSTVASHNNTHSSPEGSNGSLDKSPFLCAPMTPYRHTTATPPPHSTPTSGSPASYGNTWKRNGYGADLNGSYGSNINTSLSLEQLNGSHDSVLADSPLPTPEARKTLVRPKTLVEKARMNVAWLDSSLSIMEQGVKEYDILCLRFKFYVFYDLNPKTDAVRINQIYEQAKWQLLNEEIDCTEEEMLMFAALQLQVNTQANHPQKNYDNGNISPSNEDDIDAALTDLQTTLEGSSIGSYPSDITKVPELYDQLRFLKPKRFTLKAFKKYWFSYRDLHLYLFKTREEMYHHTNHIQSVSLKGCEVTPDINLSQNKYGIKLDVPSAEGMTEMYIRCDNEKQYAVWMAACRLASKGRSLADSSYENEIKSIMELLTMQKPGEGPTMSPDKIDIQPELYLSPRYARKLKGKVEQRILESHANVKNLPLVDAKMKYIKAWQSLPDYGISLFVVKFTNTKKDELLGVAHNRIMKMDINSGDNLKTWRYNTLKAWNVNWEVKLMMTQFEEENLMFNCLSADCKVIHEFIGGYIFLSMRSKEANQSLNQELFHKLTGGWT